MAHYATRLIMAYANAQLGTKTGGLIWVGFLGARFEVRG